MRVCITGAAGQQGSYLAERLLREGYEVDGYARPCGTGRDIRNLVSAIAHPNFILRRADLTDHRAIHAIVEQKYDRIYHLAAVTNVAQSFECPEAYFKTNAITPLLLLDELRRHSPDTRLYFAATSEMFAINTHRSIQNESWPLGAVSPYGASKIAAYLVCKQYREMYDLHIVNGIAFNNESPRRGDSFVSQKLVKGICKFAKDGTQLPIGRVDTFRDWHHSKDTVEAIHLAMEHHTPEDFVIASGETHSVEEFARAICDHFKVAYDDALRFDKALTRPVDVEYLRGDPTKIENTLHWARKYDFPMLVEDMCVAHAGRY